MFFILLLLLVGGILGSLLHLRHVMGVGLPGYGVHALHAVDAMAAQFLVLPDVLHTKSPSFAQDDVDGHKKKGAGNN